MAICLSILSSSSKQELFSRETSILTQWRTWEDSGGSLITHKMSLDACTNGTIIITACDCSLASLSISDLPKATWPHPIPLTWPTSFFNCIISLIHGKHNTFQLFSISLGFSLFTESYYDDNFQRKLPTAARCELTSSTWSEQTQGADAAVLEIRHPRRKKHIIEGTIHYLLYMNIIIETDNSVNVDSL